MVDKRLFAPLDRQDAVLDRVLDQQAMHRDGPRLADTVDTVHGLVLAA